MVTGSGGREIRAHGAVLGRLRRAVWRGPHRIIGADIVIDARGEQKRLLAAGSGFVEAAGHDANRTKPPPGLFCIENRMT